MEKTTHCLLPACFKSVCNCCELNSVLNRVVYKAINLVYGRGGSSRKDLDLWTLAYFSHGPVCSIQGPIPFLAFCLLHCPPEPRKGFVAYLLASISMALSTFIGAITTERLVFMGLMTWDLVSCWFKILFDTEKFSAFTIKSRE